MSIYTLLFLLIILVTMFDLLFCVLCCRYDCVERAVVCAVY